MRKEQDTARQFLTDIYRGCAGDAVYVSCLKPFQCKVTATESIPQIDFTRELFFSVASYKSGVVQRTGKGRGKDAIVAVGVLHFDLDFDREIDPVEYVKSKGLPVPSYAFKRAGRYQIHYLLSEPCTDLAAYEKILKTWVVKLKADHLPAQSAALMRVPFTVHKKKGKTGPGYTPVLITRKRYALSEFSGSPQREDVSKHRNNEKTSSPSGVSESILLKDRPKITSGSGRSAALYQFALRCRDFGLEEKDALGFTQRFNEKFCSPPEPASVVEHQATSAYRYAKHPPGRYLSEKPERMAQKFEADSKISESLVDFVYIAEAEILINQKTGLRYTKAAQIENAVCYASGVKTSLQYVLTFRLVCQKDRLAFRPDEESEFVASEVSYFNTFEKIRKVEKTKVRKSEVKIFEEHLKYLTNTEKEFEHLRKFLACSLLNPGQKIKHALLLISTHEGIGKSVLQTLAESILRSERDNPFVVSTSNTEIARGNNSWIESKFLTFVHELGQSEKYAVLDQLKNWITEPRVRISDKYIRSYEIENFCNFIFFSNAVNALPISATDRRFFIIVNRKKPQDTAYYENLIQTFEEGLYSIIDYLGQYADKLNINAPPPITDSKLELRSYSRNELTIFLDGCLYDPTYKEFFGSGFTIRSLAERIQDSARASNIRFSQKQAAMWLRENDFYMKQSHRSGEHLRLYVKSNIIQKAEKFKEGRK